MVVSMCLARSLAVRHRLPRAVNASLCRGAGSCPTSGGFDAFIKFGKRELDADGLKPNGLIKGVDNRQRPCVFGLLRKNFDHGFRLGD